MRYLVIAVALAALAAAAPAASALPTPLCDAVSGPACWEPYVDARPEALPGCLSNAGLAACATFTCTLNLPPSRCGNAVLAFGFH